MSDRSEAGSGSAEDAENTEDAEDTGDVRVRPFEPDDGEALWELKRGFETGLGAGTGGDGKAEAYDAKLTDRYRRRWLAWVGRCVDEQAATVTVAERDGDGGSGDDGDSHAVGGDPDGRGGGDRGDGDEGTRGGGPDLAGYVFVLPESLSFVWDAAVLNEVFVRPAFRGTGVADDLMDAALDAARAQELPLDRMVLDVDRENDRASAFYERHGFEHWGEMVARDL